MFALSYENMLIFSGGESKTLPTSKSIIVDGSNILLILYPKFYFTFPLFFNELLRFG